MVPDKLAKVVRATVRLGVAEVYTPPDPGAAEGAQEGRYEFSYGLVFAKDPSMGQGQYPVQRCNQQPRDLIIGRKIHLPLIGCHEFPLDQAADACENFGQRAGDRPRSCSNPGHQAA